MRKQIEKTLQYQIRPILAAHGGDIEIASLEGNTLRVRLLGQCADCLSGIDSTRQMIRNGLLSAVPQLQNVEFEQSVSPELMDMALKILKHEIPS